MDKEREVMMDAVMRYSYDTAREKIETSHKKNKDIGVGLSSAGLAVFVIGLLLSAEYIEESMGVFGIITTLSISVVFAFCAKYFLLRAKLANTRLQMTKREVANVQVLLDSTLSIDIDNNEFKHEINSGKEVVWQADKKLVGKMKEIGKITKNSRPF